MKLTDNKDKLYEVLFRCADDIPRTLYVHASCIEDVWAHLEALEDKAEVVEHIGEAQEG